MEESFGSPQLSLTRHVLSWPARICQDINPAPRSYFHNTVVVRVEFRNRKE